MNKLDSLKTAGKIAHELHLEIGRKAKAGVNLLELEDFAAQYIARAGMKPSFQGFHGYPATTCLSVNNEVVHAIPRDYILKDGDVLSVDLGVTCNDWIVDTARTHLIGQSGGEAQKLIDTTALALAEAIKICRPGNHTGDLGAKIASIVEKEGFFIIKELHGHGVGHTLQEPPTIANYGRKNTGVVLQEGMVLALEPITCLKPTTISVEDDDWTIVADNGLICAHVEDTIYIERDQTLILT